MRRVILAPGTTDNVQSAEFNVARGQAVTVILYPTANLGAETAALKAKAADGTFVPVTDEDANDIAFSDSYNNQVIDGEGVYRLDVTTRTLAWGIEIVG